MKDLDFRGNILSGTKYRVSPEGVSLMEETNNLVKQVGRSPADKFAESKFASATKFTRSKFERTKCGPTGELQEVIRNRARRARAGCP